MFVAGQSVYAAMVFSILSFLVAVPSAVKVFNWTATMYKGAISWQTPMLYAIGFIGLFTIGGLTGLFLAAIGVDVHVTDTYFIVAHFHYIMVGGTIMGYLGGLHYWWPKISGRLYNEWLAKIAAGIIFIGFNLTFFPQFIVGYLGHAAAVSRLSAGVPGPERPVVGRRVDPRRRLPHPDGVSDVVAAVRPGRRHQSVRRQRPRVDDDVAAADRELLRDPDRDRGRLHLSGAGGGLVRAAGPGRSCCLTPRRHHHPALAHHFDDLEQQKEAAALGMWLFLVTEVLFFGGLFAVYSVYRSWYPDAFAAASHEMVVWAGTMNTVVLITSSLTMALAVHAAQLGQRRVLLLFLALTMLLGLAFLGVKAFEYYTEFAEHHIPGPGFVFEAEVRPARPDLLLAVLRDDRPARAAHGHRPRGDGRDVLVGVARHHYQGLLQPDRDQRPLLALRRYRLDLPVSAAVPDRPARPLLTRISTFQMQPRRHEGTEVKARTGASSCLRVFVADLSP